MYAAEVCLHFDLQPDARALLRDGMDPLAFVAALAANRQYLAGIDFLAHALPAREAIWWACLCVQHACGDRLTAFEIEACRAAVLWTAQPNEEHRTAAQAVAALDSPAGAAAMAACQTGGPAAKAVAQSVKLAAIRVEPVRIVETQRLFLELGVSVAESRHAIPGKA